jgi:hypothetical protein
LDDEGLVILLAADAVNAGDAGDDDDIAAGEDGTHGGEAEALDLLVDAGVLFDECVGARDVGFGLVVIEVADEILDGALWEETLELGVGFWTAWMTLAMVKVLPEPVTPTRV